MNPKTALSKPSGGSSIPLWIFQNILKFILGVVLALLIGHGNEKAFSQEAMGGVSAMSPTPFGAERNPANAPWVPYTQIEAEGHIVHGTTSAETAEGEAYRSSKLTLGFPQYPVVHFKLNDQFAIGGFLMFLPFDLNSTQSGIPSTLQQKPTTVDLKSNIKSLMGFKGYWGWAPIPLIGIGGGMSIASGGVDHTITPAQGNPVEIGVQKANIIKINGGVRLSLLNDQFAIGGSAVLAQMSQIQGISLTGNVGKTFSDDDLAALTTQNTVFVPSVLGGFRFKWLLLTGYGEAEIFRARQNKNVYSYKDQDILPASFQNRFVIRGGGKIQIFKPFGLIGGFSYDTGDMGAGKEREEVGIAPIQVTASDFAQGGSILSSAAQPFIDQHGFDEAFTTFGLSSHLPTMKIGGGGELRFFPSKNEAFPKMSIKGKSATDIQVYKDNRTHYKLILRGEGYANLVSADSGNGDYEPSTIKKTILVFPGSIIWSF